MKKQIILLIVLLSSLILLANSLDCLDASSNSIDWFASINFPGKVQTAQPASDRKYFVYYDINSDQADSTTFTFGSDSIDSNISALYNTLNQLSSTSYEIVAWDDDPTNTTYNESTGHTKAVMAVDLDSQTGFYLSHSMPNFPQVNGSSLSTQVPDSAKIYGQSFLCMSLSQNTLESMAQQLIIEAPRVYYTQKLSSQTPNIQAIGQLKKDSAAATTNNNDFLSKQKVSSDALLESMNITTRLNSTKLTLFTKSQKATGQFIFEDLIAPTLNVSLNVESWGRPYEDPVCNITGGLYTTNIEQISINSNIYWKNSDDHSKWITSTNSSEPYICIGDMNRMTSQGKRGGSFFCQKNKNLWTAFNGIIGSVDTSCSSSNSTISTQH